MFFGVDEMRILMFLDPIRPLVVIVSVQTSLQIFSDPNVEVV